MLHWAENLLCSLGPTSFDASRIVFWALDEGAQSTLLSKGRATYRDPSLFATSTNENYRGDTRAYRRMMKERPKFFIQILAAGYDILMLDADTIFWQSPLLLLPHMEDGSNSNVDAIFSTDAREFYETHNAFLDVRRRGSLIPPVCNGIFWMRSSNMTVALWSDMLDVFNAPWPLGWFRRRWFQDDQRGMDVLLNDGRARLVGPLPHGISREMLPGSQDGRKQMLGVMLLDQTLVVNGHLLKNRLDVYEENVARFRGEGKERVAAHFNWDTTEATKEEGSKEMGMFFLDKKGHCTLGG
ncbi:hypothetical protein LTR85_007498 [Meristemomyces frigidus]|nr:hypothetical protein LTR85_007498 [Meristemomyces frigidus]